MTQSAPIENASALYRRHVERLVSATTESLSEAGYDRLLLHSGRPRLRFQDDHAPAFRAHPHFVHWVPLPRHADGMLEFSPGARPRLWMVVPEDFWHAPPAPPADWWADQLDIEIVADREGWAHRLGQGGATALIAEPDDFPELGGDADVNPAGLLARLDEARTVKSDYEIACLREANRRAVAGHRAAERAFHDGESELGIHAAYAAASGQDPDVLPYGSIVALNEHCAILHYQYRSPRRPEAARSFLIDAGADCLGYAADITRTHSRDDGEFAELVEAVDALQQRIVERTVQDRAFVDLHLETHRGIADILRSSGICSLEVDAMLEAGVTSRFFPHGLGHFLGVQVHDVAGQRDRSGTALPPPADHPFLRLTRDLEAGNVVTVEPGLYFIPQLLDPLRESQLRRAIDWDRVDALAPYGGIRVEDDVLVGRESAVNLTREAFAEAG